MAVKSRGGVLEDILGLEVTFSSPWFLALASMLRSLALVSKPKSPRKCSVPGSRRAFFFDCLKRKKKNKKQHI